MEPDPVVAEIRAIREQLAARFNYDIHAIGEYARELDARGDREVVSRPPRRPEDWREPETESATEASRTHKPVKTIPLSRLKNELQETLNECADSGQTVVVELPDQRLVAIQPLDPREHDSLADELRASNPQFQATVTMPKLGEEKLIS